MPSFRNSKCIRGQFGRRPFRFEHLERREMLSINGDFNGDGFDDLAVGTPNEAVGAIEDAGTVSIIYGSRKGLRPTGNQFWHENSPGIDGVAAEGNNFGAALAVGNFNGDKYSDLAIYSSMTVSGHVKAGAVHILYGSKSGLRATGDQLWTQDSPGINGVAAANEFFGSWLLAGDFNGDGRDDLATGGGTDTVGILANAGSVNVIYGSSTGLTNANDQLWHQDSPAINGTAAVEELFGYALAIGDFNNDGRDDLAIGTPFESEPKGLEKSGGVNVLYGSASGLTNAGDQFWSQDSSGINDLVESDDQFGTELVSGDFNGDGFDDLAIGAPSEDVGTAEDAGAVSVIFGSAKGLTAAGDQFWTQDSGLPDEEAGPSNAETADQFGYWLAALDFDGDGRDDLAVNSLRELRTVEINSETIEYVGAVHLIFGSKTGLIAADAIYWDTSKLLYPDQDSASLEFSLTAGDYNGDGYHDLVLAMAWADINETSDAGAVQVVYGPGFVDLAYPRWHQGLLNASDGVEEGDSFGFRVA